MIDKELAAFLEEGVNIHLGTRNDRLEANGARGIAVKVDDDGTHLTVYLPEIAALRLLPDLESNGHAAVVFGRPSDDRACQVKGRFVGMRAAADEEHDFVMAQWEGFLRQMEYIGVPRAGMKTWVNWPAVAIRLKATDLYNQTPGPDAGTPLR